MCKVIMCIFPTVCRAHRATPHENNEARTTNEEMEQHHSPTATPSIDVLLHKDRQLKVGWDITDDASPNYSFYTQFTQQTPFVAPKYRRLSFLSPIFVVTSRHLSEITFLLRHHSIFHFIIRTVTFCCPNISCLFRFNYSHPSWLMKDANRSLAPTARSRFRMHGTSCQSGLQWTFMSWLQIILKTGGHCFYNRNVIYCCNSTLAISHFNCALPLSNVFQIC